MQVINWLELQPLPADLEALNGRLHEVLPLRKVCQLLVETVLRAQPWMGRADLISCYHPSQTYKQGQRIALFISDTQNVRKNPIVWLVAHVKQTRIVENPIQGRFQVLTLDFQGRQIQMAGGIPNASYLEPDLSNYTAEDLAWLVEWVSDTYAAALQATLKKLIQTGQICGRLAEEIFFPEQIWALSPELLHPIFARISPTHPWISQEEIVRDLPDLSQIKREAILALLATALKESRYRSLGAGRWTTPELFDQLNREVPQGLPTSHSSLSIWTKRDEKDLAGYDRKFMPTEAKRALEELGIVESLPEPDETPWRPPKAPVRLPSLNYLHITQVCFPVGAVLHAFAPEVHMVFVQLINGDHQPFLVDRENGLLKAIHPGELRTRILKEGIPAGTHLWLEYEGREQYRIVPRLLPFKRMVPCKLARVDSGRLHVEHTQLSMMYEGNPSLFKTDMRSDEIEGLFREASHVERSVRDAMIYAIQELCTTDPDHRAHRSDIFNAVFLQRMCSPSSISLLLYMQPCFEQLAGSYFRYKPAPDAPVRNRRKRKDRLSKLWDNLLLHHVAPDPLAGESSSAGGSLEGSYPIFPTFTADLGLAPHLRGPETEPEFSVLTLPLVAVEEDTDAQTVLKEETRIEALLLGPDEPNPFPQTDEAEPESSDLRDSLDRLLHGLEELVHTEPSAPSAEEAAFEREAFSDPSIETTHEESLSFSSPFRWEPKPSWIDAPRQPTPPAPSPVEARRFVYQPKIPLRPLHKQPFYRRLFFYLRGWLSRRFRKTT